MRVGNIAIGKKDKSQQSAEITTGNKANVSRKARKQTDTYDKKKSKLVPWPLKFYLIGKAAKTTETNLRVNYYNNKLQKMRSEISPPQHGGDSVSSVYAQTMNYYKQKDAMKLQQKLQKYQRKQEKNRNAGRMFMAGMHNIGQMASIRTRRNAMTQVRGSSGGMDRNDVAVMNELYSDDSMPQMG